jgi:hypothetical protein
VPVAAVAAFKSCIKRLVIEDDCTGTSPYAPAMLPLIIFALSPLLFLLPSVAAHGYLLKVDIDGTTYTANVPNAKPSDSPIRQVSEVNPVKGSSNPYLSCGLNAQLATIVVPANPGSVMKFYWVNSVGGNVCFSCVFPTLIFWPDTSFFTFTVAT